MIQSSIYVVLGLALAYWTRSVYPVVGACYLGIIVSTAYCLVGLEWTRGVDRRNIRTILNRSMASHAAAMGTQMLYRLDIVVLGLFATLSDVGYYSIAAPIAELSWVLSEALSLAIFGRYRPQIRQRHIAPLPVSTSS